MNEDHSVAVTVEETQTAKRLKLVPREWIEGQTSDGCLGEDL